MPATDEETTSPVRGVPTKQVMAEWPKLEPILQRVVKPQSGWTLTHLLTALQMGFLHVYVVGNYRAVVITSVNTLPLHKVLWIEFMAGEGMSDWLDEWKQAQDDIAKHFECKYIEFRGRKAWQRLNRKHPDFEAIQTVFRKEVV